MMVREQTNNGFRANPDLINKQAAYAAHAGTSFEPEKRGEQAIRGFAEEVQAMYERLKPHARTDAEKALLITEMERFQASYAQKYNDLLYSHSRIYSTMIAGPSGFPTERMRKINEAYDKKAHEMYEWKDRAEKAVLRALKGLATEEAGGELEVMKKKIDKAEKLQEIMKMANAIVRKKVPDEVKIQEIIKVTGFQETTARKILIPDYMGRIGFPAFELTNNLANIHRMKERLKELEKKEITPTGEITFTGGNIVDNREEDRVQIFFDQKPPQAMIDKLKGEGWRWAPSVGAWSRKRTDAALYSARRITGAAQPPVPAVQPHIIPTLPAVLPVPITEIKIPSELVTLVNRYKKHQDKVDEISKQTDAILQTSAMGQAPPIFHRLVEKQLDIIKKDISPIWDSLKNYNVPNSNFKTFWQETHWTIGTLPPSYQEIEAILNKYNVKIPVVEQKVQVPVASPITAPQPQMSVLPKHPPLLYPAPPQRPAEEIMFVPNPETMTRAEYVKEKYKRMAQVLRQQGKHHIAARVEQGARDPERTFKYETSHRDQVVLALAQNKPVSPEVLKDYPDIVANIKKVNEEILAKIKTDREQIKAAERAVAPQVPQAVVSKPVEPTDYFTLQKAKKLIGEDNSKLSDEQLHKKSITLRDYIRFIESADEYSRKTLIKGGYFAGVTDPYATGLVPADLWLHQNLKFELELVYKEQDRKKTVQQSVQPQVLPSPKIQTIQDIKQHVINSIQEAKSIDELKQILKGLGFLPLPESEKRQLIDLYQIRLSELIGGLKFGERIPEEEKKKRRAPQKVPYAPPTRRLEEYGVKEAMRRGYGYA